MVTQQSSIPPHETTWLLRYLTLSRLAVSVGLALALVVHMIERTDDGPAVLITMTVHVCILLLAERWVVAGKLERGGIVAYAAMQSLAVALTLLLPGALISYMFAPIAAIILVLPYLRRHQIQILLPCTWLVLLLMIVLSQYMILVDREPQSGGIASIFGMMIAASFVLTLLWRYHARLLSLVESLTNANTDLARARAELEQTVASRTEDLRERETRSRLVSELITDFAFGLEVATDGTVRTDWSTGAISRLTGFSNDAVVERGGLEGLVHPDDRAAFVACYRLVAANQPRTHEFRILDAHGEERWLYLTVRPIWSDAEQRVVKAIGALQDITDRKRYEEQIMQLAFYDSLTTLANRRLILERLSYLVEEPATADLPLTVIYLDLDRFKVVNDTLGHDAGDALLVQVAERLRSCVRENDLLARLGGDEFAVVLPGANEEQAVRVAQRMLEQFDPPFRLADQDVRVGTSVGIACYPRDGEHVGTLLQHADIAMYAAKAQGNRYRVYHPSLHTYREEQLQIESDLRVAIDTDALTLHYQPIRDLYTSSTVRVEALVRWMHPTRGSISPGVFIPIAEDSGLIRVLDRWVLRAGMRQAAVWAEAGSATMVAVNLSTVSLQERDLTAYVRACLAETGAPPEQLVIEITESAAMRDPATTLAVLNELRELGIQIALDDFGKGYASLNYLASLPVDTVKVDREFVAEIGNNHKHEGVLRALITLCRSLGLRVVAEGVETDAQLQWLIDAGYDQAQGYFIGRPVAASALERELVPHLV